MKKGIIAIIVLGLLGAAFGYYQFNRGHKSMANTKSDLSISANDLFLAFSKDETSANTQFLDKTMSVTGKVSSSITADNLTTITLFAGTETGTVSCKLDPLATHAKTSWNEGEQVTIKGKCTGSLSMLDEIEVILERCIVE